MLWVSKYKLVDLVVTGTETFVCGGGNKSENEAYTPDNSGTSENSDNTVIFLPYKDETDHSRESSHLSAKSPDKSAGKFYIAVYSWLPLYRLFHLWVSCAHFSF